MNVAAGSGRRGGRGGGRGIGRGMGMADLEESGGRGGGARSKNQELKSLKQQADSLNRKMKEVISRINSLGNR